MLRHVARRPLASEHDAEKVHRHHAVVVGEVVVEEPAKELPIPALLNITCSPPNCSTAKSTSAWTSSGSATSVALERRGVAERRRDFLAELGVHVGDDDLGAFGDEQLGGGAPDPARAASDDRNLARELVALASSPSLDSAAPVRCAENVILVLCEPSNRKPCGTRGGPVSDTDFASIDLFRDKDLPHDPYPFYEWVREQGPVLVLPALGRLAGHRVRGSRRRVPRPGDLVVVQHRQRTFPGFSVPLEGDDITDIIEAHRDELPFSDQLPSFDPPKHTEHRGLLMRLITPKRLKESEEYMWRLADQSSTSSSPGRVRARHGSTRIPFTLLVDRRPARRAR